MDYQTMLNTLDGLLIETKHANETSDNDTGVLSLVIQGQSAIDTLERVFYELCTIGFDMSLD